MMEKIKRLFGVERDLLSIDMSSIDMSDMEKTTHRNTDLKFLSYKLIDEKDRIKLVIHFPSTAYTVKNSRYDRKTGDYMFDIDFFTGCVITILPEPAELYMPKSTKRVVVNKFSYINPKRKKGMTRQYRLKNFH